MTPGLPTLTGAHLLMLLAKMLAVIGFTWTANLVILYAC